MDLEKFDAFLFCGEDIRKDFNDYTERFFSLNTYTIVNRVIKREVLERGCAFKPNMPISSVVSVAGLRPQKDFLTLLKAKLLLQNEGVKFDLYIIGEGGKDRN